MGLRSWWKREREQEESIRRSLALNDDQDLIAVQVPELAGMSDTEGMAYTLQQIEEWNKSCTPEHAAELAARLAASNEAWNGKNMTMPYWGNLWVLRTYQASLGLKVPAVAPPASTIE
jgi:hypothetical protein